FLLTEAHYLPAKLLQTSPSIKIHDEYGVKTTQSPIGSYAVIDLDLSQYTELTSRFEHEHNESLSFLKSGIATRNTRFNTLITQIERVAQLSAAPMLLTGPTGAGKSFLAQRIYELRQSRHFVKGRFIAVNCATLRGDNAMSTLFGHEKGAFTGASQVRQGRFEQANGGSLFLDEIGDMPLDIQTRLLRVLAEGQFYRVGGYAPVKVDVRIIAATHQDLEKRVNEGDFREDLYHRLNVIRIQLPPLRDRAEDIPSLARYFLQKTAKELGVEAKILHQQTLQIMMEYSWSGNVRQLENVCRWLTVMTASQEIM
ncbi:RNA repair transcriptional activator RtcR family protein, partial [Pseudomonas aeruginosa]|uniref:RNA repair transcriptional activator RtcR family protein n=1 Tax=Pseudomonas aeruginosa TaxID=287 RepID=UPI0011C36EF5